MDFTPGQPLDECWNALSRDTQGNIAAQVAEMIQDMQSIDLLKPGTIGGGPCQGWFFTGYSADLSWTLLKWKLGLITS